MKYDTDFDKTICDIVHNVKHKYYNILHQRKIPQLVKPNTVYFRLLWPLLLTWFNFNPSMDK